MERWIWAAAVGLALLAGWLDWKHRRIPNRLTLLGLFVGVLVNSVAFGWVGTRSALAGAGLALGLLLPLVILRGLGAGDWKLMGSLGAFLGPRQVVAVLLITFFVAGGLAILEITRRRRWKATLRNIAELLRVSFVFGFRPHPAVNLDNPRLLSLPFGTAAAVATLFCGWHFGI